MAVNGKLAIVTVATVSLCDRRDGSGGSSAVGIARTAWGPIRRA